MHLLLPITHLTPERAMKQVKLAALSLLIAIFLPACVTTTTRTTTWGGPPGDWARYGHVESIRETVWRQEGNPAGGAVVGAIVGGLLGSAIGGRTHVDRWGYYHHHGSAAGAAVGAVGGAMVGAAASQGSDEHRSYEVLVRFDDGGTGTFTFGDQLPFRVGDSVCLTPQGLTRG
jgi:outer membrane lipoprotein SlyB